MKHNHNSNADKPDFFFQDIDENGKETWSEGVSIFHNPNAKIPIDKDLFPSIAHHEFREGQIKSSIPDFYPYASYTIDLKSTNKAHNKH